MMVDDAEDLYPRVMGRPESAADAPAVEFVNLSGQFAAAILHRLGTQLLGTDEMARGYAVTEAVKLDRQHRDRAVLRAELKVFLSGTVQTQDVAIPVWLNLIGFSNGGAEQAIILACRYDLDTIETGRAVLVGLDTERLETLAHIAGMTGANLYRLVCNAVQIEADAGHVPVPDRRDHV